MKKRRKKIKVKRSSLIFGLLFLILIECLILFIKWNDFEEKPKNDVPKVNIKEEEKMPKEYEAKMIMVGDALIHSGVYMDAEKSDGTYDFKPMLQYIKPIVSKYDLKVIPVVNKRKALLGIITVDDIIDVIRGKQSNVNAEFVPFVEKGLQQYADEVEAKLREIKVDLLHENIVYVGGGACVMKRFGRTQGRNIQYVTDVKANAIGYRYLAENLG